MIDFPNVEDALVVALADFVAAGRVVTETPPDLAAKLPMIRVGRRGGGDDGVTDKPRVDIEIFAATRAVGIPLAEAVRQHLIKAPAFRPGDPFDRIVCDSGPQEVPWGDGKTVRRWIATYTIRSRRRTA